MTSPIAVPSSQPPAASTARASAHSPPPLAPDVHAEMRIFDMVDCALELPPSSPTLRTDACSLEVGEADARRAQFLSVLARGLASSPTHMGGTPGCSSGRGAAVPAGTVAGPDFFAEVSALQERLSKRRLTKRESEVTPGITPDSVPPTLDVGQQQGWPASGGLPSALGSDKVGSSWGFGAKNVQPRNEAGPSNGGEPESGGSIGSAISVEGSSLSPNGRYGLPKSEARRPPADASETIGPPLAPAPPATAAPPTPRRRGYGYASLGEEGSVGSSMSGGGVGGCMEERRARPGANSISGEEATDEELLRSGNDGKDLLRWAEEVLRKACAAETTDASAAPVASALLGTPRVPRPPASSLDGMALERQRRAEDLKATMRRLTSESESECDRLGQELEAARQRHNIESQGDDWRDRLNSAAEEMRSNFSRGCTFTKNSTFEGTPGGATPRSAFGGATKRGFTRPGGGVRDPTPPPPRPPGEASRPSPAVRLGGARRTLATQDAAAAAWARLEEQLDRDCDPIHFYDIPWPSSSSITGASPGDSAIVVKQRLTMALRRWHPDKWRRIIDRVPKDEQAQVMERVKGVAQRLLEEKALLTK